MDEIGTLSKGCEKYHLKAWIFHIIAGKTQAILHVLSLSIKKAFKIIEIFIKLPLNFSPYNDIILYWVTM